MNETNFFHCHEDTKARSNNNKYTLCVFVPLWQIFFYEEFKIDEYENPLQIFIDH
jgi:hypothetical protein